MDFRWRVVVDFPNWFQITLPTNRGRNVLPTSPGGYVSKRSAREAVCRFAERFGLKIGEIEVKTGNT